MNAISEFYRELGVAAGRGQSGKSVQVDRLIDSCRVELARFINADSGHIVFCFNGTDALNIGISGIVCDGDHVVTTDIEHNSVLRPVNEHAQLGRIHIDIVKSTDCVVNPDDVAAAIKADTRLVCISHVSNVTGVEQDVASITEACRKVNPDIFVMVDASQSVGHAIVDVEVLGCDILASSGHKGLLGPLGTGFIYLSDRAAGTIRPVRFGGTGSQSESVLQPRSLPHRLESGNPNVGGIAGMLMGIRFVVERGIENIIQAENRLATQLVSELDDLNGVKLYGTQCPNRTGVVSFNLDGMDPQSIAVVLGHSIWYSVACRLSLRSLDASGT